MVIKIIKTGYEIIQSQYNYRFIVEKLEKEKFLVLPSGLNCLEEMLKDRFEKETDFPFQFFISDVFARFKKEHGIKEE